MDRRRSEHLRAASSAHRVRSSCRSRSRVLVRSSSFDQLLVGCERSAHTTDETPDLSRIAPCPAARRASATACHPAITPLRVAKSFVFPGFGLRPPSRTPSAIRCTRSRKYRESPRSDARWMASLKLDWVWPRTARSVALAAIRWARKCCAKSPRHSRCSPWRVHRSSCASRRRAGSDDPRGSRSRSRLPRLPLLFDWGMSPTRTSGPLHGPTHDRKHPS